MPSATATASCPAPPAALPRRWTWFAALALAAAVALAYSNTFTVPFLFDDTDSILKNPTLHSWRTVFFPPSAHGETVSGRPLLNATFALNYAISGTNVWSYHLLNLLIHLFTGLTLFGLIRRTLAGKRVGWRARPAFWCALAAAAIWLLHPLQTAAVTYIVQRAESLMALWYLLTLYCFARAAESNVARASSPCDDAPASPRSMGFQPMSTARNAAQSKIQNPKSKIPWLALSLLACALGMATKEVMASAPLLVLLYDRAFVSGTLRAALRSRRKYYAALAATWLILAACLLTSGFRGGSAGYDTPVTWWIYAITQCKAILIYLKLVFWPAPQIFDYGIYFERWPLQVLPHIIAVALLAATALYAIYRWPRAGIFGALFFAVLAPTSSVIPLVTQPMAEHRMYLPSAAIITAVVVALWSLARKGSGLNGTDLREVVVAFARGNLHTKNYLTN